MSDWLEELKKRKDEEDARQRGRNGAAERREEGMDWVNAYFECRISRAHEVLKERVERDIKVWRSLAGDDAASLTLKTEDKLTIVRRGDNWVNFAPEETCIVVHRHSETAPLRLYPVVTEEGECRLRPGDDDKELFELWQASRFLLEDVLFG